MGMVVGPRESEGARSIAAPRPSVRDAAPRNRSSGERGRALDRGSAAERARRCSSHKRERSNVTPLG
eukprot:6258527-Prymnesium_polylepis.2